MSLRSPLPACFALTCIALACFALSLGGPAIAWAQRSTTSPAPASPALTTAEAQRALAVLQDPQQRARLIETLQMIAKATGPVPAEAASAIEAKPAAEPAG